MVKDYALNKLWCEESSNKVAFTATEWQNGITYKGAIVSNQLNGVSYILSQILQFNQCSGGYYNKTKTYYKDNFVDIIHKGKDHALQRESYICIDESTTGIINQPPVKDAIITNKNGIDIYTNGVINAQYWKRVDVGASNSIDEQRHTLPAKPAGAKWRYVCELMRLPDITYAAGDDFMKEVSGDIWVTSRLGTKSYSVNMKFSGKYILNKARNAYNKPRDFFNMPVPNISFGECIWNDDNETISNSYQAPYDLSYTKALTNQTINANNLITGVVTPYGFNVVIGYTTANNGDRFWAVFLAFAEAEEVSITGKSSVALALRNSVVEGNISIQNVIPVRPFGGAAGYDRFLELVEYDTNPNTPASVMLHYSKGEIELTSAKNISNKEVGAYWLLSRIMGTATPSLKEHSGRHTRCYGGGVWAGDNQPYAKSSAGQLIEPGLPNVWALFYEWASSGIGMVYCAYTGYGAGSLQDGADATDTANKVFNGTGSADVGYAQNLFNVGTQTSKFGNTSKGGVGVNGWDKYPAYRGHGFSAARLNPIYKGGLLRTLPEKSNNYQPEYGDVTTKSISIARYIKVF